MNIHVRPLVRFSLLLILIPFVFTGALCQQSLPLPKGVTLTYWRVYNENNAIQPYIDQFQVAYPYVKIQIKNFSLDEYQDALVSAWAKGEGPDLYSIPNFWLGKYVQYSAPLPAKLSLKKVTTSSSLGRSTTTVTAETIKSLTEQQIRDRWVDAVPNDIILNDQIYALPLSMDTLVMYYNKDLLAQQGIAVAPKLWTDFLADVPKLTVVNEQRDILRSGAALGTHSNVQRYFDVLSLLMLQGGITMTDGLSAKFNGESLARPGHVPGLEATDFYTAFANPKKGVYSWNDAQLDSLEAFTTGQAAFFFGYWYHLDQIKKRSPSLNFGIASIPQISPDQQVNFANYWVEAVAKSSPNQDIAWAFLQTVAQKPETYLTTTSRPAALRSLVAQQQTDPILGTFANEALTAKTWYHGMDPDQAEQIFADLIDAILGGVAIPQDALDIAARQISQTLNISE